MYPSEKQFSETLTPQGLTWEYESKRFPIGNTTYTPDFYVKENDTYYEVVGTRQAYSFNKKKYKLFFKLYPNIKLIFVRPNGDLFKEGSPKIPYGTRGKLIKITTIILQSHIEKLHKMETARLSKSEIIRRALDEYFKRRK